MKWAYSIKYKLKAALGLTVILFIILGGNIISRQKFSSIDESMHSIYNDRLKASVYIYEISQHLHEKRLLTTKTGMLDDLAQHDKTILLLAERYEKTYLTSEEKYKWNSFKTNLLRYNDLEQSFFKNASNTANAALQLNQQFSALMQDLNSLNNIQITIGRELQKNTHTQVGNTMLLSTLEMSLLIVLGLFTLVILSVSDNAIFKIHQKNTGLN